MVDNLRFSPFRAAYLAAAVGVHYYYYYIKLFFLLIKILECNRFFIMINIGIFGI